MKRNKLRAESYAQNSSFEDATSASGDDNSDDDIASERTAQPGELMFLDRHTPQGLFDPRTDSGRALIARNGDKKIAIFLDGEGPKFRHQVLSGDKIAFGRWYPLAGVVNNDGDDSEAGDEVGVLEVEDGIVRMLILWASGQPVWTSIGVSEADDAMIDNYDLIAEGWSEPFASRKAADEHPPQVFEWLEPLLSSFVFNISE